MDATFTCSCAPPPIVVSVSVTPVNFRTSAEIRSAKAEVAASVEPSGARKLISNCDWSSTGRKFFPTNMNNGTMLMITTIQAVTTTQRWAIDQVSIRV